jgi:hypothetical protein
VLTDREAQRGGGRGRPERRWVKEVGTLTDGRAARGVAGSDARRRKSHRAEEAGA